MSTVTIKRRRDASGFLDRAGEWLMRDEAGNNLILGLADRLLRGTQVYDQQPYFAIVEQDGAVAGCCLRTPPFKLLVTDMPPSAVEPLVDDVAEVFDELPAVLGPEQAAAPVAERWARLHGKRTEQGMRQRIYQLTRVTAPANPPAGELRVASKAELPLVTEWVNAFSDEVHMPTARSSALAEERIVRQELFLWYDEGEPRSMAAWAGRTPNSVRVAYVFTPPAWRGRGYASACTAASSQRALDAGYAFCLLFTDLANPTSNSIYQALGYAPVGDVVDRLIVDA